MDPLSQIALLLINTACSVFLMLVWLRFLLQASGADFYNPMSQFVVKATSPILHPLRRLIPSVFGLDFAALVLIFWSSWCNWRPRPISPNNPQRLRCWP